MRAPWHEYGFVTQMPHMAPGEKLSEVELLKQLAAYQWESIARMLGRKPSQIANDQGDRLYGSVIDVEVRFAPQHGLEVFGEDASVHVRNRVAMYAKKFVEGLFVIDGRPIPDSLVETVKTRDDLRSLTVSWAAMTNAFIVRSGGNVKLKVFKPSGVDDNRIEAMRDTPQGIRLQGEAQETGDVRPFEGPAGIALADRRPLDPIVYTIVPESDLNGAGLVYFARYEAMMNYGERVFLCDHLAVPVSTELVSCLSTEHRRALFFANASPTDQVEARVSARLLPPGSFEPPEIPGGYRTPVKLEFRIDLYRASDRMLMACSRVRKALNVPGSAKAVLNEVSRLLRAVA
jgi:probable biosynthetic protein (TIGR04098 family)